MGPEYVWWTGMWLFPIVMPIVMLTVMLVALYLIFGRGGFRPPWFDAARDERERRGSDTALEILKQRYAKGELTKEEFDQMKRDLLS
jgi:putative membrane protein